MNLSVPHYIKTLIPYSPGKPIEETQREHHIEKVIKLASNENPLGPSPKAMKAISDCLTGLHRYPDASGFQLKKALSSHLKVEPSQIILGNGSNEIIDHLIRTYCLPGDSIVTHRGAFVAYSLCAQIHGVTTSEVALDSFLNWDVERLLEKVDQNPKVKIVFLANPNNPTGAHLGKESFIKLTEGLRKIRQGSVILALDYAYWEYVTSDDILDPLSCLAQYSHTIILQTFSKVYGLAGLRIGYGYGPQELIAHMEKVRQPFNVNSLALAAAEAALGDVEFVEESRKVNQAGLTFWKTSLAELGVPFWGTQGNFILADVHSGLGKSGKEVFDACLALGVIFRPVTNYSFPGALRISVGTEEENKMAVLALSKLRSDQRRLAQ